MSIPLHFALGQSDFKNLRESGRHYVDKSLFVKEVVDNPADAMLILRPRRFGKTLNLSMLKYFFETGKEDRSALFEGLEIATSQETQKYFQRYPVIFVSFKDILADTWADCAIRMKELFSDLFDGYKELQDDLSSHHQEYFEKVLHKTASVVELSSALSFLVRQLAKKYKEKVVVLIDEYDAPILQGYLKDYYDPIISFFRPLFSSVFKDNPYLFKGVLSGILRVAKESLFSGLNNLGVYSLLRSEFSKSFGFTEQEVQDLTQKIGKPELLPNLRRWYNGYRFSDEVIYNPWSIISFLSNPKHEISSYWVATNSNDLIEKLLFPHLSTFYDDFQTLLQGGIIEKTIESNTDFKNLEKDENILWSFLLLCGYLKAESVEIKEGITYARLQFPNQEVALEFERLTKLWFQQQLGGIHQVQEFLNGLLSGDAEQVEQSLNRFLLVHFSYHDVAGKVAEKVYHSFVMGLLVSLPSSLYAVRSNRESGKGRYDIMVIPTTPGKAGVVLEFKAVNPKKGETKEAALAEALLQIEQNQYITELVEQGAFPIHKLAAVFEGKQAYVKKSI